MPEEPVITVTGHEQYRAWHAKEFPPVEQLRSNVWSIPVPFPGNPLRYTISYLLLGTGASVLIDPGWDSDDGWQHLAAGLEQAGITPGDLTGIVATHYHPDHHGMTARLKDASDAWLAMGGDEWIPDPSREADEVREADMFHLSHWGVPQDRLEELTFSRRTDRPRLLPPDLPLASGEMLPVAGLNVRAVSTPGHTPGHLCLVDEDNGLVFSGDHVLPRISPHISLEHEGLSNPLADYFDSLTAIDLGDDVEVCPAHEYRFTGLSRRVAQLARHNQARSDEVRLVLQEQAPASVWEVARELTWSRGWASLNGFSLRLALAETASHLVYLASLGHEVDVAVDFPEPVTAVATDSVR